MSAPTKIRPYATPADLENQYHLWLKATDGLPYAWRSNLTNAQFVSQHAAQHPGSRLFAHCDGQLVGYIGTHSPVEWSTNYWLMPFGFPWTYPHDPALEQALYDQMIAAAPNLYPDSPRPAGYVQRYRGSWKHHLSFLETRGWEQRWIMQLLGHPTINDPAAARAAMPLDGRIDLLTQIAATDPLESEPRTAQSFDRSFTGGWLEPQSTWIVEGHGAFEIEMRKPWAEVRLLLTTPAAEKNEMFWKTLYAKAADLGATEVYFTIDKDQAARQAQLERRGFRPVETGVFPVLKVSSN